MTIGGPGPPSGSSYDAAASPSAGEPVSRTGGHGGVPDGREEAATELGADPVDEGVLRVLLVDDEPVIRTLLRTVIARDERFEVVGEAADGQQAIDLASDLRPDIVLLDLLLPRLGGRAALPQILRASPRSMVLVLSALSAVDEADSAFTAGAFAYLEKSVLGPALPEELHKLHERFRRALRGETVWARNDPQRIRR